MAAGVSQTLWSMQDRCEKTDAVAPKTGKRFLTKGPGLTEPARAGCINH
jgi:hypothetical protein